VRLNAVIQHVETSNAVHFGELGVLGRAGGRNLQGDIAEVIAYDRNLNERDREDVGVYLNEKYALNLRDQMGKYHDSNGDGMSDDVNRLLGLDPYNMDVDGDGVTNADEKLNGTNIFNADTDGDGVPDGSDFDPLNPDRSNALTAVPGDTTPPVITLTQPSGATPLP
jgi:hypothetical protein